MNRCLRRLLRGMVLPLLQLLPLCAQGQPADPRYIITVSRLGTEDGLVSSNVLCGLQDSRGFVWFGTTDGLQRYDGQRFRLFSKASAGLQFDKIGQIAEDRDGQLWILYGSGDDRLRGTLPAVELLDLHRYSLRSLAAVQPRLPFAPGELRWFFADEQRNIFLITSANAVWQYSGGGRFRLLLPPRSSYSFFPHSSLYQAWAGHLWLSSDSSVLHLDTAGRRQEFVFPGRPDLNVFQLRPDGSAICMARRKLLGNDWELPVFTRAFQNGALLADTFQPFRPSGKPRRAVGADYLLEYHADVRTRGVLMHNPNVGLLLRNDTAVITLLDTAALHQDGPLSPYAYFTDAGGGHWLCSSNGVYRFKVEVRYFTTLLTRQQLPASTAVGNQARGIWSDTGGRLYLARDGLYRVERPGGPVKQLNSVHPLLLQGDGRYLWYSSFFGKNHGLTRMDLTGGRFVNLGADRSLELWSLYLAADGNRYAGGKGFIGRVNGDAIETLKPCGGDSVKGTCYQFLEPGDGCLLAVTDKGLYELRQGCYQMLQTQPPVRRIHQVYIDRAGRWWLCTAGDGLLCWEPATGRSRRWTGSEGLPSGVLYGLLEDGRGLFWISSANGLIRFDPRNGRIRVFTRRDGLPHNEFNRGSFYRSPEGRFFFGGLNGFVFFDPLAIPPGREQPVSPPLQLLSLQSYQAGRGVLQDRMDDYGAQGRLALRPGELFLLAQVVVLDYLSGPHRYDYRLEGLDATWRSSADGSIRLDNIPYGDYVLRIRGQSADGSWSRGELRIPLRVTAPFYREPAFVTGCLLTMAALVWLLVRARLRMLARANRRLEEMVEERTAQLRALLAQKEVLMKEIHHRVKNNLQVISALQQMQSARSTDATVKAALEESQNRVLSIAFIHHNLYQHEDLNGVEMQSFVTELTAHIASVFAEPGKRIGLKAHIDPLYLDIDTAVPLGLIVNELLTNSYKYAFSGREQGRITIALNVLDEAAGSYLLKYGDDGPGLPEGLELSRAQSLGLRLIRQLSRQLAGNLAYTGGPGGHYSLTFFNFEARNREP